MREILSRIPRLNRRGFFRSSLAMQMHMHRADVAVRLQLMHHKCRQQERRKRERSRRDQQQIYRPVQPLATLTVGASHQVRLIVSAQILRNPRNIIPPARQNRPNHLIGAGVLTIGAVMDGNGHRDSLV